MLFIQTFSTVGAFKLKSYSLGNLPLMMSCITRKVYTISSIDSLWFHVQDQILEALRKEYWRPRGYPSELSGSDARKDATYKEGKILKYYKVKNRIFTNSAAIATVLKWLKQTQGGRRFSQSVVRF
ncbi:hypothetical protein KC19_5G068600 [Ceratodon purpureus]|uniref:Uncharacterized protein n=1 Tax=Ceratodon purpureus TaxID=3225 RepID=A0A8T0I047_CERPU|nr:hypothetical protein KC19_5G068600 [Ceratodon purpureus]